MNKIKKARERERAERKRARLERKRQKRERKRALARAAMEVVL